MVSEPTFNAGSRAKMFNIIELMSFLVQCPVISCHHLSQSDHSIISSHYFCVLSLFFSMLTPSIKTSIPRNSQSKVDLLIVPVAEYILSPASHVLVNCSRTASNRHDGVSVHLSWTVSLSVCPCLHQLISEVRPVRTRLTVMVSCHACIMFGTSHLANLLSRCLRMERTLGDE